MDINEGTTTEDLWTPYKELVAVVEGYLAHEGGGAPYAVHTFESVLRRHKQTFLSLLKNPPKNHNSREEIKRGITDGVNLPSIGRTLLSKELVDEAIIISDMYNVNEYLALELLHTARAQLPRHPGLPRGLVAVLLYYDGRRALMQALRDLAHAVSGVCWSISVRDEITTYVTRYMEQLISDGLLGNALDTLRQFTLQGELELLQNNRAIPPHKHNARLVTTIQNTRKLLAGTIFAISAQRGLNRDMILRLISEQSTSPTLGPTGALDDVSLALQMSLLYALDLSVLHSREDGEELAKKLPLIQDPELISVLIDELLPPMKAGSEAARWSGVRALCQLALGVSVAALRTSTSLQRPALADHDQLLVDAALHNKMKAGSEAARWSGVRALCQLALGVSVAALRTSTSLQRPALADHDQLLVDAALHNKVFEYIDEVILSSETVLKEEYYQRRLHTLITDFIVLMHSKLMEMRVKADEAVRAEQMYAAEGIIAPGGNRTPLSALLRCVEKLYASDPHSLREEYWRACDNTHHTYRSGGRTHTLYKFVRLSGELVSAPLLGGYLRALAALCVPTHTWALLSRRLALSAHHLLTAIALYRNNLHSDPTPFANSLQSSSLGASAIVTPAARPGKLLVRQEEVEAMIAALRLIAAVASRDSDACAQICENPQWDAVNCMFGLICCHVPIQLKAELCKTLAALGGTPATAGRVWTGLEAAGLLTKHDKRGLAAELQEVESRMEEYPLSIAFLGLVRSVASCSGVPRALGAGTRPPGLDVYLDHLLNRLALPAPHRPYTKPHEKWQILSLCYAIFYRWLEQYEPAPSDFPPKHREAECNPPPGFRILIQLHTKSELLRLTLDLLDEAQELMDTQPQSNSRTYIEETMISALQILDRALVLERPLINAANEAGRGNLVIGLSKLVMAPEGPENKCRVLSWCLLCELAGSVPRAAAAAVALLCRLPAVANLLPSVSANDIYIRHAFVECLEAEAWGGGVQRAALRHAQAGLLLLLLRCLAAAPPNLAHYLLGYRRDHHISRSALNEPGAAGYPRTCLHSILDILEKHIANNAVDREATDLEESCYRLIYTLASRPSTSGPLLRFLRSRDHFLPRHLKATINLETASVLSLSARSWLVRACACEAAAAPPHHAALAAALAQTASVLSLSARSWLVRACACEAAAAPPHHAALAAALAQEWEWCLIRRTLEGLPVSVEASVEPRWELFDHHQLSQAIAACDLPTGMGGKRISVSRVHAVLSGVLQSVHANAPQRNLLATEIQKVLDYVTEVNRQRNLAATLTHYYDSWRQLTEIIFCVAPPDLLDIEAKKNLLLNILQELLNKIPPAEVLPQIGNLASGTVLLLLVNLRHCYILQKRETSMKSMDFETTFFGPSNQIMQTKSLTLKFILHKILSWILISGGSTQKMRVNLYGALLNYLNIVNLKPSPADPEEAENTTYVSRLDSTKVRQSREESSLKSMVVEVINSFGDNLSAIVCSDCIGGGHDVCRMVALSCLETLIEINPRTDWINTLTNQGYLRSLIDSLMQDDEGLKEALEANPRSLRVVYVYESKLALLTKLARARVGAELVVAQGGVHALANLRALDHHPDVHAPHHHAHDAFLPALATRFRQILVPALSLLDALLTSLGTENHACVIHVNHFLLAHIDAIDVVLRAAHPNSPDGLLIELEAVTSVIARASNRDVLNAALQDTSIQLASLERIRSLMLALLARWSTPSDHQLYCKIACNILRYWYVCGRDVGGSVPAAGSLLRLLLALLHQHTALTQLAPPPPEHTSLEEMKKLVPGSSGAWSRAGSLRTRTQHAAVALDLAVALLRLTAGDCLRCHEGFRGELEQDTVEMRKSLVATFNDRFIQQLLDTTKNQTESQHVFMELMIKDIKSMVQFSV